MGTKQEEYVTHRIRALGDCNRAIDELLLTLSAPGAVDSNARVFETIPDADPYDNLRIKRAWKELSREINSLIELRVRIVEAIDVATEVASASELNRNGAPHIALSSRLPVRRSDFVADVARIAAAVYVALGCEAPRSSIRVDMSSPTTCANYRSVLDILQAATEAVARSANS